MTDYAVRVEELGKLYVIDRRQEKYSTLRDTIVSNLETPFRRMRGRLHGISATGIREEVWALKGVNFEVKHGEVIGIIGRNGAGKSTLLKILSRITEPTAGHVDVYGRVGALLEVGTGFHSELTGRENIFLNGAILGMSREEIRRKFDEIVDFAGVEKFIDTPVKHYSSGMGLRLGFAVAAHLEPDILIVDEVLAVGDAEFQRKCMGKMGEVAGEGRTVIFVSHNMAAVRHLCSRGIYLNSGEVNFSGEIDVVIGKYFNSFSAKSDFVLSDRHDRKGGNDFRFINTKITDLRGDIVEYASSGAPIQFCVDFQRDTGTKTQRYWFSICISDLAGTPLFTVSNYFVDKPYNDLPKQGTLICRLQGLPLVAGTYKGSLWCGTDTQTLDHIVHAFELTVEEGNLYGTGKYPKRDIHGVFVMPDDQWSLHVE